MKIELAEYLFLFYIPKILTERENLHIKECPRRAFSFLDDRCSNAVKLRIVRSGIVVGTLLSSYNTGWIQGSPNLFMQDGKYIGRYLLGIDNELALFRNQTYSTKAYI